MEPYSIIIAWIPASGKTTYARHIAEKLHVPFIGKDAIKEKLYDILHFDTSKRENSQLYGMASYSVFYYIAECLMKADISFVLESNFTPASADILLPLTQKYNYRVLTVLFDADMEVLHKRFCERDVTDERHPGLTSKSKVYDDFDTFSHATLPLRDLPHHESIETSERILRAFIEEKEVIAVFHKADNKVIGSLGLHHSWANDDEKYNSLKVKEIGYMYLADFTGDKD